MFSVALSRGSPRVAVSHHPALWSPDFPRRPPEGVRRDRPASPSAQPAYDLPVPLRLGATKPHPFPVQAVAIGLDDQRSCLDGRHVLPDPERCEAECSDPSLRISVSITVSVDLVLPEVRSGSRHHKVLGTPVPEATIDEDVEAGSSEYNVGSSSGGERQWMIDPESHARSVQDGPHGELRACVSSLVRQHRSARRRRDRRIRCRWHRIASVRHAETDPGGTIFAWHASTLGGTIR